MIRDEDERIEGDVNERLSTELPDDAAQIQVNVGRAHHSAPAITGSRATLSSTEADRPRVGSLPALRRVKRGQAEQLRLSLAAWKFPLLPRQVCPSLALHA
jgi:hypothetical protein